MGARGRLVSMNRASRQRAPQKLYTLLLMAFACSAVAGCETSPSPDPGQPRADQLIEDLVARHALPSQGSPMERTAIVRTPAAASANLEIADVRSGLGVSIGASRIARLRPDRQLGSARPEVATVGGSQLGGDCGDDDQGATGAWCNQALRRQGARVHSGREHARRLRSCNRHLRRHRGRPRRR